MSRSSPRRPSTLAADRYRAAQRPLGASLVLPPNAARADERGVAGVRTAVSVGASAGVLAGGNPSRGVERITRPAFAGPDTVARSAPAARTASAVRAQRDNVFVTSIVVAFVFLTLAIASLKVSGSMRDERSRTAIAGTLTKVYELQSGFRAINQRFATWPELRARGVSLPAQQRVVASNASKSHWFMAVRDTNTGIVCSRTGELFDDSPFDRQPSCSAGTN